MTDLIIIIPTYNKEKYVEKALDSILEQQTKYKYELLISDDCSSDNTLTIIKEKLKATSIRYTILPSQKNMGLFHNIMKAYEKIDAKYFTVLDPDDYWCDKNKIEVALNYLESNLECTIYSSNVYVKEGNFKSKYFNEKKWRDFNYKDYLDGNALISQTSGTIYRNVIFNEGIPDFIKNYNSESKNRSFRGDSFRNAIHIHKGKCHYDPVCRSVYQITDDGIWTSSSQIKRDLLNILINKDLFLLFNSENIELLQKSYDSYKVLLKRLPSMLLNNNNTKDDIINLFNELTDLQILYSKNSEKLIPCKKNKNIIKNRIITLIKKIYNKVIFYLD